MYFFGSIGMETFCTCCKTEATWKGKSTLGKCNLCKWSDKCKKANHISRAMQAFDGSSRCDWRLLLAQLWVLLASPWGGMGGEQQDRIAVLGRPRPTCFTGQCTVHSAHHSLVKSRRVIQQGGAPRHAMQNNSITLGGLRLPIMKHYSW